MSAGVRLRPLAVHDGERAATRLQTLVAEVERAEHDLAMAVGLVKLAGWTWDDVALVLSEASPAYGATKAAACNRWTGAVQNVAALVATAEAGNEGVLAGLRRHGRKLGLARVRRWYP